MHDRRYNAHRETFDAQAYPTSPTNDTDCPETKAQAQMIIGKATMSRLRRCDWMYLEDDVIGVSSGGCIHGFETGVLLSAYMELTTSLL